MQIRARLLLIGLAGLCLLTPGGGDAGQEKQGQITRPADIRMIHQSSQAQTMRESRKTAPQSLEQRVAALEEAVEKLTNQGLSAPKNVPPVQRLPRDDKADDPAAFQHQITRLWNQINKILDKLDEITGKQ